MLLVSLALLFSFQILFPMYLCIQFDAVCINWVSSGEIVSRILFAEAS